MQPYYDEGGITIYHGDCREVLPSITEPVDVVVADPPYGETSLTWDVPVRGFADLLPGRQWWCFGSLRMFMACAIEIAATDWRHAQDIVYEKHNGSSFHADRFKRVHELAAHFYRGAWADLYRDPPRTNDATARTTRRKHRPAHTGGIAESTYTSEDGGPRLMRSVIPVRSCHGYAEHPTQKPLGILRPLIQFSCPPGGTALDPFTGSGSTLVAAKEMGRRAVGIEINERFCEVAANRLAQGVLPIEATL